MSKRLVGIVERMRTEQARSSEETARLTRELEAARGRLAASEQRRRSSQLSEEERE